MHKNDASFTAFFVLQKSAQNYLNDFTKSSQCNYQLKHLINYLQNLPSKT